MAIEPDVLRYVRVLIADTSTTNPIFPDADLEMLFAQLGDFPLLVAASALEAMAADQIMLGKKISSQDLSTDGVAVSDGLLRLATAYRQRHEAEFEQHGFAIFDPVPRRVPRPELTEFPTIGG